MTMYSKKKYLIPEITPVAPYFESVDKDLLMELMSFQTPTYDDYNEETQDAFLDHIEKWVTENVKADVTFQRDVQGDLYITKGMTTLYPAVVSHVDIVHDYNPDLLIVDAGNLIIGLDSATGEQKGIGADPKNGVYFALEMLRTLDFVKVVLFKNEEQGCVNSRKADLSFFKDCSMVVQLDRRSFTNDFIEYTNGIQVVSEEFKEAVQPILVKYNYRFNDGSCTDVGALVTAGLNICAFNFSNGSINEHMDCEVCSVPHLLNAINGAYEIILELGYKKQWEHNPDDYNYASGYYNNQKWKKIIDKFEAGANTKDKKIDDWLYDGVEDVIVGGDGTDDRVYHHSPGWTFNETDEDYIQDQLETGTCPVCTSSNLEELEDGESHCYSCHGTYNIPYGKGLLEVEKEIDQLTAGVNWVN